MFLKNYFLSYLCFNLPKGILVVIFVQASVTLCWMINSEAKVKSASARQSMWLITPRQGGRKELPLKPLFSFCAVLCVFLPVLAVPKHGQLADGKQRHKLFLTQKRRVLDLLYTKDTKVQSCIGSTRVIIIWTKQHILSRRRFVQHW